LPLGLADERIDLGDGLIAWRWGEGPAVLLVHGFEGNRAQFAAIIEALVERGFAAVALDVPAHRRPSSRPSRATSAGRRRISMSATSQARWRCRCS